MADKLRSLFATQIYQGTILNAKKLNQGLLTDIYSHAKKDAMGQQWSEQNYKNGFTSYASLMDMHHRTPSFMQLAEELTSKAEKFSQLLHWDTRGLKLEMTACWFNIMNQGAYHTLHMHPHSVLSGAYYVQTPPKSVALKLEDPRISSFMSAPVKKQSKSVEGLYCSVEPKAGSFVFFESWLRHEVPPNFSSQPRVSVSFNFSLTDE